MVNVLDDLFEYNDWAHGKIFAMCEGLPDEQIDLPRDLGLGSLRKTLYHNYAAEQIWLERWTGQPWRQFPLDPAGMRLDELAARFHETSLARKHLMDAERSTGWTRIVEYKDAKGNSHSNRLVDLLLHVANHGIHHRAQALSYLKQFDRTIKGGLDYLFFRFARPSTRQEPATIDFFRHAGMEFATGSGQQLEWDAGLIREYFAYNDWANQRILNLVNQLDEAAWHREFSMGQGSIQKTILHMLDAERWWFKNWTIGGASFEKSQPSGSLSELQDKVNEMALNRDSYITTLDSHGAQRIVTVLVAGQPIKASVMESLVQLCGHGTHHRAQVINMTRQCNLTPPAFDLIVWIREKTAARN